jgi:hypothetical protein
MVKKENILEKYKFLRLYDMDFESALHTLKVLRRYKKKDVRYALIRDVIVTYSRPFTESKGFNIGKDFCGAKFDDKDMKELHDELLRLRKELFAHTDLTYKNPKVRNWSTDTYKWFPMSFKGFDYKTLEDKLPEIKRLIEHVQKQNRLKISEHEKNF